MIDIVRCNSCRRIVLRKNLKNKPGCAKCGKKRFENPGRMTPFEEIGLLFRNPNLIKAVLSGEPVNV